MTDRQGEGAPQEAVYSESYKGLVLCLLAIAYGLYFIDRTIISTVGQAIKVDLKLSDTQLGWLGGMAFALFNTVMGVPLARLAERYSRVNIMAVAIVVWSGFTALCGTAGGYVTLLLYRIGVGVGEAGLTPSAHSLISDYYEPRRRASALAIFAVGVPLGGMIGAAGGGWIAENLSWRLAFFWVGLPGVLLAIVMKLLIKEPPRGWADRRAARELAATSPALETGDVVEASANVAAEAAEASAAKPKPPPAMAVARRLFGTWSTLNVIFGMSLVAVGTYGPQQYSAPYFIRTFGLNLASAGLLLGLIWGFANGAGALAGGFITDWAARRNKRLYSIVPAVGLLIACPLAITAYTRDSWPVAAGVLLITGMCQFIYMGPTFAMIQNAVDVRMRATSVAMTGLVVNLIGLGFGPPLCGFLSDHFAGKAFNLAGRAGDFIAACPGGVGPKDGGAALDAACKVAMASGTRMGIVLTLLFLGWAGIHYLLAAITLPKDIARAQASAAEEAAHEAARLASRA